MTELRFLLIRFLAECRAHPMRTPNLLLGTVKEIRDDPAKFLLRVSDYSPEAVALVYSAHRRLFPGQSDLAAFEAGSKCAVEASDIRFAADAAVAILEQAAEERGRGRSRIKLVEDLAVDLGKLFVEFDGHLKRTVHDGESGPFHAFVTVVAELVRPFLRDTGYTVTPETMVGFARKALVK